MIHAKPRHPTRHFVANLAAFSVVLFVVWIVTSCDATYTMRAICRGDSTPALADTSLVRCSTLDTLARKDSL